MAFIAGYDFCIFDVVMVACPQSSIDTICVKFTVSSDQWISQTRDLRVIYCGPILSRYDRAIPNALCFATMAERSESEMENV